MSTRLLTVLASLVRERRLLLRPSNFTGFETVRTIYTVPEILAITCGPFGDTLHDERLAEFAQTLDAFSEGGRISVAQNPDQKPWDAVLARVHPVDEEFWSIRVTAPEETPGIRAFGAFVEKDGFAVVAWHLREEMSSFDDDVMQARVAWKELFGSATPHRGSALDDYLSDYWEVTHVR
jgi:hypothetical protein